MEKIVLENTRLPIYINFFLFLFLGISAGALGATLPPQDRAIFFLFTLVGFLALFFFIYKKSLKPILEYFRVEFYLDKIVIKDFFGNEKIKLPINKVEIIIVAYKKFYKVYNLMIYIRTKDKKEFHIPMFTLKAPSEELKIFYRQIRHKIQVEVIDIELLNKISGAKK